MTKYSLLFLWSGPEGGKGTQRIKEKASSSLFSQKRGAPREAEASVSDSGHR